MACNLRIYESLEKLSKTKGKNTLSFLFFISLGMFTDIFLDVMVHECERDHGLQGLTVLERFFKGTVV